MSAPYMQLNIAFGSLKEGMGEEERALISDFPCQTWNPRLAQLSLVSPAWILCFRKCKKSGQALMINEFILQKCFTFL